MKHFFTTNWYIDRVCPPEIRTAKSRCNPRPVFACEEALTHSQGFEECLLEAIDVELSTLGKAVKRAVYFHLEKTLKIRKKEIPHRIDEFADAMEKIFGDGAKFLEIQIMKQLHKRLGKDMIYVSEKDELTFTEYVEAAKLADTAF